MTSPFPSASPEPSPEPSSVPAPVVEEGPPSTWERLGGLAVCVWGGALLALVGAFLTPFRLGGVLIPISVVLVIVGNWLLLRFGYDVTGSIGLSLLAPLVWLGLTLAMSSRTTEGDLVLAGNNWVANVYIFVGSIAAALFAYRLIKAPRPSSSTVEHGRPV